MTFFYRGPKGRIARRSTFGMRLATTLVLTAYPLGCIAQLIWRDETSASDLVMGEAIFLACMIVAIGSFIFIAPSYLQRIAGDEAKNLDEFEQHLRRRAYAFSYQAFTALTLCGLLYLAIALDAVDSGALALWRPETFEHWNAIIWGALLYAFVLPTAYLAWAAPSPALEDEAEA